MLRKTKNFLVRYCLPMFVLFGFLPSGHLAFAAQSAAVSASSSSSQQYLIGLGDIIEVDVWKEPDLTKQLTVRLDGRISLPLVGDITAAGRPPMELAKDIGKKLSAYIKEPSVSVTLVKSTSRRYYVIGKVAKPGEFAIDSPITVLQALARSGGFVEWAKKDNIVIIRRHGGKETFLPFDYGSLIEGKNPGQNIKISPGDTIVVP